ncbi:MAG: hypothetical protein AVDCRST_MAG62-1682, partial [uncultured Sphingomonas sp.]
NDSPGDCRGAAPGTCLDDRDWCRGPANGGL